VIVGTTAGVVGLAFNTDFRAPQSPVAAPTPAASASEKSKVKPLWTADDAVKAALADALTLPPGTAHLYRWLLEIDGEMQNVRLDSLTVNWISRSSAIYRPTPLYGNHLVRVLLPYYAPRADDLREWLALWEDFAFDPTFARLVTRDNAAFAGKAEDAAEEVWQVVNVPGYNDEERIIDHEGGPYTVPDDSDPPQHWNYLKPARYRMTFHIRNRNLDTSRWVKKKVVRPPVADVERFNSPAVDAAAFKQLQHLTDSQAPVVDARYFRMRALRTIKDAGVFARVWGGRYYDFKGIKKAAGLPGKEKATDLDLFFENLGVGNIKAGETAEQLFARLRSDQRVAMFRSGITGKGREASMWHDLADKEGAAWGAITGDVRDQDVDVGDRPFANLLTPRRKAREAIFPGANGLPVDALFNGEGALQDRVPPDVAVDRTIPAPHTQELQPPISCIRCHGPFDHFQPLRNDVKTLMAGGGLDIFGDLGAGRRKAFDYDTLDRLAGLYAGNFDKALRRARDDTAEATLRAMGPLPDGTPQANIHRNAAELLGEQDAAYWYDLVTPRTALADAGVAVEEDRARAEFNRLVTPDTRGAVAGVIPESPVVAALRRGIGVTRQDWALQQSAVTERVRRSLAAEKAGRE
jgi:hypothetical protein